jgi:hypothetical protein
LNQDTSARESIGKIAELIIPSGDLFLENRMESAVNPGMRCRQQFKPPGQSPEKRSMAEIGGYSSTARSNIPYRVHARRPRL